MVKSCLNMAECTHNLRLYHVRGCLITSICSRIRTTALHPEPVSPAASRTWLQTTCGGCPAHHRGYGTHHCSHPGVGDTQPLQWRVATSVQKDVESAQEARQGVDRQHEQGDSGNAAGQSEGHSVEGAGAQTGERREYQICRIKACLEDECQIK